MQLLSREQGGFIVALSLLNNRIHIGSTLRPKDADDDWKKRLPSIERDKFEGRTTFHRVEVRWGPMGYVRCKSQLVLGFSFDSGSQTICHTELITI